MLSKQALIAIGAISALIIFATSHAKPTNVEKSFKVKAGGTLYLDSDSGSIDIETHSEDSVEIEVTKKGADAENFEVTFEQRGDDVIVEGERNRGGWGSYTISVKFRIKVPEKYDLDLKTGGGSIDVSDLNGKIDARTSGGSIELGRIKGDVDINTSGGSIKVDEVIGNIDAHTSGGSIKATISKQPTKDAKLSTSGGSVTAYLLPSIKVDLDASTSGGRVKSDFDVDGEVSKRSVRGEINGGGPKLKLKTSGGSVSVRKL